jgi:O-antigen/teichoic acid export membrane protein
MDNNRKSLFKNISSNYILLALLSIISFLSSIIFSRVLSPENYGLYTYLIWLTSTLSVFTGLGLSGTIAKFFPEYYHNYRFNQANKFIKSIIIIQMVTVIIAIFILLITLSFWIDEIIDVRRNDLNILIVISIITILPNSLLALLISTFQALQRFDVLFKIKGFFQVISFILNTILIIIYNDFLYSLIIIFISAIAQTLLLTFSFQSILKKQKKEHSILSEALIPKNRILNYAKYMYINVLWQQVVFNKSEIFFLGIYSTASEIAIYGIAFGLVNIMMLSLSPLMTVLNNFFSSMVAKKEIAFLEKIINKVTHYFIIFLMFTFIYVLAFSKEIVDLIYTNQYSEVVLVFLIMFSGYSFVQIVSVAGSLPFLMEKQKIIVKIGILIGLLNLFLDFILIPRFGAIGASLANTSSQLLSSLIVFFYIKRLIFIKIRIKNLFPLIFISFFSGVLIIIYFKSFSIKFLIIVIYSFLYIIYLYFKENINLRQLINYLKTN